LLLSWNRTFSILGQDMQTLSIFKHNITRIVAPLTFAVCSLASAPSLTDANILGIYVQVNSFDIETALAGQAHGTSDALRSVASHVASDHLGVRQQAYELAGQCNVAILLPADRDSAALEHSKTMTQLLSLSGAAFDRAYTKHEVAFHRSAIDAVRKVLLPATTCQALKTHLNEVLPAFEHHLDQAEALERALAGN
jgi:predicted outer membrane protein